MGVADEKQLPLKLKKSARKTIAKAFALPSNTTKTQIIFGQLQRWMFPENSRI